MSNFFGTDGIRGIFKETLTTALATKLGNALAQKTKNPKVLIGSDTRTSSDILKAAVGIGVMLGGGTIVDVGVVPTPCVSYLTSECGFDFGVMISASHNPPKYNGIKVFKNNGQKMTDDEESDLEIYFSSTYTSASLGRYIQKNLSQKYINFLIENAKVDLSGFVICLDCSNGAAYNIAPRVFKKLGAKVFTTAAKNMGEKININCGSLHIENLIRLVKRKHADIGFAFDGDADRVIAVDSNLEVYDGDKILYVLAKILKHENKLYANTIVGTSHTNSGIVSALAKNKINLVRTDIGDKYVIDAMRKMNLSLGGEKSGHIILGNIANTGDGILTALKLTQGIVKERQSLSLLCDAQVFPQENIDIIVKDKIKVINSEGLHDLISSIFSEISPSGRVLVRASGTENKIRIMVEHPDPIVAKHYAKQLKKFITKIKE